MRRLWIGVLVGLVGYVAYRAGYFEATQAGMQRTAGLLRATRRSADHRLVNGTHWHEVDSR